MADVARLHENTSTEDYFGPADILKVNEDQTHALVAFLNGMEKQEWAQIALPYEQNVSPEEQVLISGNESTGFYLTAVLRDKRKNTEGGRKISMSNDVHVNFSTPSHLQIVSQKRGLLFEYDSNQEKARITMEDGDLEFISRTGDIQFQAAQNISFAGNRIKLEGQSAVDLNVAHRFKKLQSTLSLGCRKLHLASSEIDMRSGRADIHINETHFSGNLFIGIVKRSKLIANEIETTAKKIIERTKNFYQTISQLKQVKTGRARTLVEESYHLQCKKSYLKAKDDFKINGKKIHIG